MDLTSNGIIEVGRFHDQINDILIVLDDRFKIQYFNEYTLKLLKTTEKTDLIGLDFKEFIKLCKLQISIDENKKIINNNPLLLNDELKQLKIVFGTIDNKQAYFLLSQTLIEIKETYKILAKNSEKIIGQTPENFLYAREYVDEIKKFFENIIRQMPCYVYWKDKEFRYVFINDLTTQIMGLKSPDEAIGKTDYDFGWDKKLVDTYRDTDTKIFNTGIPRLNLEEDLIDKNGCVYHTLVNKLPLKNSTGEIVGILGITVDVSNIKEIELKLIKAKEAAEAANIAKTVFIANISHDIRTPLSSVIGLSNIIENAEIDPKLKMHAHNIAQSGDELLNMLNRVISSVSSGKLTVDDVSHEPFDLRYLIESLINLESSPADLKHIQLITYIDDQIPNLLIGDHDKLYHIILNLVGNALKFTEKGHIKISIALTKKLSDSVQLLFEVSDTGMGIPPDSLNKVFDMFYKVTPSYKGKDKGHGMGLYIVKTYTELLGGHVSVESKLNEGSKFSFTLTLNIAEQNAKPQNIVQLPSIFSPNKDATPIRQTVVSKISDPSKTLAIEKPQNTPEILAIEDNKAMLSLVETLIKKEKCTPTTAEDGESGLELAKTKHFDLILSDVGLPGISGIEFAQKLRQYEKEHNKKPVPIVAITGHGQVIQKECLAAGMNYVILKPIKPETLTELCSKFALFSEANNTSSPLDKLSLESIPTQKVGHLGPDLPDTEAELFEIDALPIFDIENAGKLLGDNTALLMKMLRDNLNIMIPQELPRLKKAHEDSDWQTIAAISHKLKGGFLSISLTRLAIACQYLERYQQAGHSTLLERLYQQVLKVIEITSEQLRPWAE